MWTPCLLVPDSLTPGSVWQNNRPNKQTRRCGDGAPPPPAARPCSPFAGNLRRRPRLVQPAVCGKSAAIRSHLKPWTIRGTRKPASHRKPAYRGSCTSGLVGGIWGDEVEPSPSACSSTAPSCACSSTAPSGASSKTAPSCGRPSQALSCFSAGPVQLSVVPAGSVQLSVIPAGPVQLRAARAPPRDCAARAPPRRCAARAPPRRCATRAPPRDCSARAPPRDCSARAPPRDCAARAPPRDCAARAPPRDCSARAPLRDCAARAPPRRRASRAPPRVRASRAPSSACSVQLSRAPAGSVQLSRALAGPVQLSRAPAGSVHLSRAPAGSVRLPRAPPGDEENPQENFWGGLPAMASHTSRSAMASWVPGSTMDTQDPRPAMASRVPWPAMAWFSWSARSSPLFWECLASVKTAPASQLLNLLSVSRLVSVLDEADACSVVRKLQELDRGVLWSAVIGVEGEEQWGENATLRGARADGVSLPSLTTCCLSVKKLVIHCQMEVGTIYANLVLKKHFYDQCCSDEFFKYSLTYRKFSSIYLKLNLF